MAHRLSAHALVELERRGIPLELLEPVLAAPEQKVPELGGVVCYQSKVTMDGKVYLLRAMVNETATPPRCCNGVSHQQDRKILESAMKVTYDPEVDVLRILFRDAPIDESDEDKPGIILDYDKDGNIVGLEVLNASQRVENPRGVEYAMES